ncbi:hypothetical protein MMAG44476_28919 [Mycolicibacterium mageritense DSM 44476 = CIP 104973]|uniref:Uncharacterized protein n=2 Tax=Mycobacteriaceae TaxID=1762 RepID=A0AAI8U1J7_MYCME|nr:hypothetical protein [Mycolicibacterium mageritense]MCC9180472.1 hypothetical protein [Mycolicibacterium mageritense]TXI57185.1 MAG: hypothetical protein E6Q55_26985 [Mycolicibacterium mageritense]BBX37720.1 hypothetical protein MMAGJ_70020 [Mycolicibacterium mageritense]BDY32420.1 hypothetical protein hbim_06387 [Mycolicibacterium mageritense]GJJ16766.1 hypothetical protein MTY414_04390 [Mycolicibacterium mageritense]
MTDALMLTVVCFICGGAAGAVLSAARRRRCARPDDEATERLVTIEELVAEFDHMLIRKGLMTSAQLALIRHGTRSRGVVTGMRATGTAREDYREVELDLMVTRPGGGQFPATETALIPASSLAKVSPGSVIDAYYRPGDEGTIAVCVSPC